MANSGPSVTKLLTDPPRWVVKWPDGTTNTYNHQPTEKNLQNPKGSGSNIYNPPKGQGQGGSKPPNETKPNLPKGLTAEQAQRKSGKNRYWWKDRSGSWHYHLEGKTTTDEIKKKGPDIKESKKKEAFQQTKKYKENKIRSSKQEAARGSSPLANQDRPSADDRRGKKRKPGAVKTTPTPTTTTTPTAGGPAPTNQVTPPLSPSGGGPLPSNAPRGTVSGPTSKRAASLNQRAIKNAIRNKENPPTMPSKFKPQEHPKPGTRGSAGPGTNMSLYNKAKKRVLSRNKR